MFDDAIVLYCIFIYYRHSWQNAAINNMRIRGYKRTCIVSSFIIRHSWQNAAINNMRIRGYKRAMSLCNTLTYGFLVMALA